MYFLGLDVKVELYVLGVGEIIRVFGVVYNMLIYK